MDFELFKFYKCTKEPAFGFKVALERKKYPIFFRDFETSCSKCIQEVIAGNKIYSTHIIRRFETLMIREFQRVGKEIT